MPAQACAWITASCMNLSKFCFLTKSRWASAGVLMAAAAGLTGCYVVPTYPASAYPGASVQPIQPVQPMPLTFSARLYPANERASAYGMVSAVVTNDLNGRGVFSTNINGESFSGEATRVSGSSREGLANGAGSRGGYINCRYRMNSATQGTGSCNLANGAQFTMHVGS